MPIQSGTVSMGVPDPEWSLDEGSGPRTADATVVFATAFDEIPTVVVSISSFRTGPPPSSELDLDVESVGVRSKNVTKVSLEIEFVTDGQSRIEGVGASWLAYTN